MHVKAIAVSDWKIPRPAFSIRVKIGYLALLLALTLSGCGRSETKTNIREFNVRGIVRAISPDRRTLDIQHEAIPDYMPAMIMPFELREPKAAANLKIGDAISFRLLVDDKKAVIDRVSKLPGRELDLPPPAPESAANASAVARLRAGDDLPAFNLTNQNGETITQETFRGQPLVLTFIFTRCPVPNFCPLMSQNFAHLQDAIRSGNGAVGTTRLLSISFDPDNDTPQVLRDYASAEQAEPQIWTFATGTPSEIGELTKRFAVLVQPEGGTISHGLATALIDSHGRIREIWRGNGWKPEEIIAALNQLPP